MSEKLATFRCDGDLWEAFKEKARANGSNASALLLQYVRTYLDESRTSLDEASNDLDLRIDERLEMRLAPVLETLAAVQAELGNVAA